MPAATQTELLLALNKVTNYVVPWFLTQTKLPAALTPAIEYYRDKVAQLATWLMSSPPEIDGAERQREEDWLEKGVRLPRRHIAIMPYLATAPDIAQLAEKAGCSVSLAAATFFGLGHRLGLDWLRKKTEGLAGTPLATRRRRGAARRSLRQSTFAGGRRPRKDQGQGDFG